MSVCLFKCILLYKLSTPVNRPWNKADVMHRHFQDERDKQKPTLIIIHHGLCNLWTNWHHLERFVFFPSVKTKTRASNVWGEKKIVLFAILKRPFCTQTKSPEAGISMSTCVICNGHIVCVCQDVSINAINQHIHCMPIYTLHHE